VTFLSGLSKRSAPDYPPVSVPEGGFWDSGMVWRSTTSMSPSQAQAMQLSAVFACLRLLSEAVSTLPLDTFVRQGGSRRPYRPRPAYLDFPQPGLSRIDYLSQVMLSLLTDGNAYILTPRDALGITRGLLVLDPCEVSLITEGKRLIRYEVAGVHLDPYWDVMHIKGMCLPGALTGVSPIAYARETIGLGLAAQRFGANFFENGALPSAVIEVPKGNLSPEAAERFRDTWHGNHGGVGNAQKIGVLTEGATLNKVSIQPDDAQFLETRAFQVPDIARIYGVPPHLIADASNSTSWGTGLQEQNLAFGQFSLRPWTERIEEGHGRLLTSEGLPDVFMKLNMDALLRASLKDRYDSYAVGISSGFLTPDEARTYEDMPPLPNGAGKDVRPPAPAQPPTGGTP